jgi:hypothetical protein
MRGRREERIEAVIDHVAALVLAAAVTFATFLLLPPGFAQRGIVIAASGALAFGIAALGLRAISAEAPLVSATSFELPPLEFEEIEELVLTDADRLRLVPSVDELVLTDADRFRQAVDELVLDDILAKLGPDSRVVRLFDPGAMPTPGQLNARIERHLHGTPSPAAPMDASQALYEALSELRRSLR